MIGYLWTRVRKQPIIAFYFEFENELKFYNLEAWSGPRGTLLSYPASIRCLAIIGPPAKRHQMAFRWRADDDQLLVVY